jgi:hypothetical protein
MRYLLCLGILVMAGVISAASMAPAQVTPGFPGSPDSPAPGLPVVPDLPPPAVVPPVPVVPVRPLTVNEFVTSFTPLPGKYEVVLIHPKTGSPVKVRFTLPPGCVRKVRVNGHKIVFDYKCQRDVVIRFLHGGGVSVRG